MDRTGKDDMGGRPDPLPLGFDRELLHPQRDEEAGRAHQGARRFQGRRIGHVRMIPFAAWPLRKGQRQSELRAGPWVSLETSRGLAVPVPHPGIATWASALAGDGHRPPLGSVLRPVPSFETECLITPKLEAGAA